MPPVSDLSGWFVFPFTMTVIDQIFDIPIPAESVSLRSLQYGSEHLCWASSCSCYRCDARKHLAFTLELGTPLGRFSHIIVMFVPLVQRKDVNEDI